MASKIELRSASVGSMDNNVYVLVDNDTGDSILVDAPTEPETISRLTEGTNVRYILLTHGDGDHIQALKAMQRQLGAPVGIHEADSYRLPDRVDFFIHEGDVFQFGSSSVSALHTPGHTPGSICLVGDGFVISGDTLFPGGPGETRRPGGDFPAIIANVRDKLFTLPDDTKVYPGHGKSTTIGAERPHLQEWMERGH
ncbi:MAG TPA: MBL fold metallo-hydrolase [Chloroflexota bacterium]|nr:MBL fold metallo-hydrolase [Chloroflexota bacterium]